MEGNVLRKERERERCTYSVKRELEGNVFRRRELEGNVLRKERECVCSRKMYSVERVGRETYSVGENVLRRERESFEENVTPSTAANQS